MTKVCIAADFTNILLNLDEAKKVVSKIMLVMNLKSILTCQPNFNKVCM